MGPGSSFQNTHISELRPTPLVTRFSEGTTASQRGGRILELKMDSNTELEIKAVPVPDVASRCSYAKVIGAMKRLKPGEGFECGTVAGKSAIVTVVNAWLGEVHYKTRKIDGKVWVIRV